MTEDDLLYNYHDCVHIIFVGHVAPIRGIMIAVNAAGLWLNNAYTLNEDRLALGDDVCVPLNNIAYICRGVAREDDEEWDDGEAETEEA